MGGLVLVRKRLGGSILNEDTSKIFYFAYLSKISELSMWGGGMIRF
jgi:hypothetical protein